jgi:pilus assembly protein CpaE
MEVARVVLGLEELDVAEEVMHFLDRTGRARVVATAADDRQLAEAIRQLEPDAVVASTGLVPEPLDRRPLLVVETAETVRSLRHAIRAGAAGYFVWPREREALAAATLRARRAEEVGSGARVVAVVGARGGVGTTFVATHLAAALARRSPDVALVDLDVPFGGAGGPLGAPAPAEGAEEPATAERLLAFGEGLGPSQARELLWRHPQGFGVLLSPARPDAVPALGAVVFGRAISALSQAMAFVVLDVPRETGTLARTALAAADPAVVVLGLDVGSFRDARRLIEATGISERCGFVVNRASRSEVTPGDVERVFGRPPLAVIPRDRRVPAAQDRGRLLPARGRTGRAIDRMARTLAEGLS